MPGGYGNINGDDGVRIKKGDKLAEKWTEKKALELGNEMIEWLNEVDKDGNDVGNMLFEEFLVIKKRLYSDVITYLRDKFTSFSILYEVAKKTQEIKLHKYGLADRLNAQMCKFSLAINHGWVEKRETEQKDIIIKIEHSDKETQKLIDGL